MQTENVLELVTVARQDGVVFPINERKANILASIYNAWCRKHTTLLEQMYDELYTYGTDENYEGGKNANWNSVTYMLFVEDSRDFDSHSWLRKQLSC